MRLTVWTRRPLRGGSFRIPAPGRSSAAAPPFPPGALSMRRSSCVHLFAVTATSRWPTCSPLRAQGSSGDRARLSRGGLLDLCQFGGRRRERGWIHPRQPPALRSGTPHPSFGLSRRWARRASRISAERDRSASCAFSSRRRARSGARQLVESVSTALPKTRGRLVVIGTAGDPRHWSRKLLDHATASPAWRVSDTPGPPPWMDENCWRRSRRGCRSPPSGGCS